MGKIKTTVYSISLMMMMMMMITETSVSSSKNEVADMFATAAPYNLNGKMFTLSSNGRRQAGVSFYPPYFTFHKNKVWADPTRVYPHGAYRSWAYRSRAYPTRAYRSWDSPTRPYRSWAYRTRANRSWPDPTRAYPTRAYPNSAYPTRAYPTRAYPTRAYRSWDSPTRPYRSWAYWTRANRSWPDPTRAYPTRAYRSWDSPTRPYRSWAYRTRANRSWPDPTRAYPTRAYPTRAYPTRAYPTRAYPTRAYPTSAYPSWTTEAPTKGVTVCLRYLLDSQTSSRDIFTLSPTSRAPLTLSSSYDGSDLMILSSVYWSMRLKANVRIWAGIRDDLWTRLCLTVDTVRGVVQVFSGSYMSIRKMAPSKYVWSGEPVIAMSGVDGQVTDVQIWDYPLSYNDIFNYMTPHNYGWPRGSVLTWSDIRYTATGRVLLEDVYEQRQAAKTRKKKKAARKSKKE
ncbi:uncharacterized protein LOC127607773 isoform X2 [Hippocampus zosterae]|uniref:uncharacterized protein LOC127607773 isoform X2 n=1 Tax=Hippocampus zosterae TaxID=109293 RepID=UPI00223CE562|nr:uncharacterized protein LOC127607773 isoform X2 [Hippocampus zosterae]